MFVAVFALTALIYFPNLAAAQDDPPSQAGRLAYVRGAVSVQTAGTDQWEQAMPNVPLGPGDRVYADSDGQAEIQVGQVLVRIGANSDVTLVNIEEKQIVFGVARGSAHFHVFGDWQAVGVNTPSGSVNSSRQVDFRVDSYPDQEATVFTTNQGNLHVFGAGGLSQYIPQGRALELTGTNPVYPQWVEANQPDALDQWSTERDQRRSASVSARYVNPDVPGSSELDDAGRWQQGTDYGAVWFPNNVSQDWAPYHNGHWVNRPPWGSVWVEDESWGYAPFHYGRWVHYEGRWGWVPGPVESHPVWSPALVVFAGGIQVGGIGVSAWFPLGPGEAYRPWYPCSPRYIDRVNITNIQESRVVHVQNTYVNVVNVTNVTNITYVNKTIGVTAMRHEDFAAGRAANQTAVHVDAKQMAHVQVLARPAVSAPVVSAVQRPPARPVPVPVARPVLINNQGMQVVAKPNAKPVEPPVKPVSAAVANTPLPGHRPTAPPPGVVAVPRPGTPPPAAGAGNAGHPGNAPANNSGNQPANNNRETQQGRPVNATPPARPNENPASGAGQRKPEPPLTQPSHPVQNQMSAPVAPIHPQPPTPQVERPQPPMERPQPNDPRNRPNQNPGFGAGQRNPEPPTPQPSHPAQNQMSAPVAPVRPQPPTPQVERPQPQMERVQPNDPRNRPNQNPGFGAGQRNPEPPMTQPSRPAQNQMSAPVAPVRPQPPTPQAERPQPRTPPMEMNSPHPQPPVNNSPHPPPAAAPQRPLPPPPNGRPVPTQKRPEPPAQN